MDVLKKNILPKDIVTRESLPRLGRGGLLQRLLEVRQQERGGGEPPLLIALLLMSLPLQHDG